VVDAPAPVREAPPPDFSTAMYYAISACLNHSEESEQAANIRDAILALFQERDIDLGRLWRDAERRKNSDSPFDNWKRVDFGDEHPDPRSPVPGAPTDRRDGGEE